METRMGDECHIPSNPSNLTFLHHQDWLWTPPVWMRSVPVHPRLCLTRSPKRGWMSESIQAFLCLKAMTWEGVRGKPQGRPISMCVRSCFGTDSWKLGRCQIFCPFSWFRKQKFVDWHRISAISSFAASQEVGYRPFVTKLWDWFGSSAGMIVLLIGWLRTGKEIEF